MKALPSLSAAAASSPTRPSFPNPLVSSTTPPASEEPSPTDLLLATPPTLLKLFALCAPAIHAAATFSQLVTWTHPNFFASLLVLLGWWGVCLFGQAVALYGLNAAVILVIARKYLTTTRRTGGSAAPPPSSLRHRAKPATLSPAAYAQLINSANVLAMHVQALRSSILHPLSTHFSFTPLRPSTPAPAYNTAWLLLTSYPFYLLLTYLVPLRYLFLLAGSVAILWQAPFFATLRTLLWRSAFVRWACRLALGVLGGGSGLRQEWGKTKTGLGIPGLLGKQGVRIGARKDADAVEERPVKKVRRSSSTGPAAAAVPPAAASTEPFPERAEAVAAEVAAEEVGEVLAEDGTEEGEDVQVQFTVFENQRWWVGLDWTHALLPGERASWTDPANNPANPPASFSLPPPSIAYIPSPTKSDPRSRLKKTTEWRWLDPEWHVLRSAIPSVPLAVSTSSTGAPAGLPSLPATSAGDPSAPDHPPALPTSPTISRIAAAAGVSLPPSLSPELPPTATPNFSSPAALAIDEHSPIFAAWTVDDEGWQYGDNHFEKMGPRGGLGKYTRRRAWVRRAGLIERTERVSGTEEKADGKKESAKAVSSERRERKTRRETTGGTELGRRSSSKASATGGAESVRRRRSVHAGGGGGKDDGQAG
ncbi:hypothetical protein JCM10213_006793 [Rhodosporidiobolus nylandii]